MNSQPLLCLVCGDRLLPLFPPSRAQQAHFEPHHHSIAVQSHRAGCNTSPTLVTRTSESSDRGRNRAGERLIVKHIDGDRCGHCRAGVQALIASYTGMQFLRHLGSCLVQHYSSVSISLQSCLKHLRTFLYRCMLVRIRPEAA